MSKKKRRKQKRPVGLIALVIIGLLLVVTAILVSLPKSALTKSGNVTPANPALVTVSGRPSLKVDQDVIDYGYVKLNTPLTFTITVTNIGDKTLRFTETPYIEIAVGCCPPSLTIGSMVLKPGESTTIESSVFMMHAGMVEGYHDFRVHLPTNDPSQPDAVVKVLSNWVP